MPTRKLKIVGPVFYIDPQGQASVDELEISYNLDTKAFEFLVKSKNALEGWTFIVTEAHLAQCRDVGKLVEEWEKIV